VVVVVVVVVVLVVGKVAHLCKGAALQWEGDATLTRYNERRCLLS
jgi:hypothetical protein